MRRLGVCDASGLGVSKHGCVILSLQPGGSTVAALKAKIADSDSVEFPAQAHGWVVRGDLASADVQRDVKAALSLAIDFFSKHV